MQAEGLSDIHIKPDEIIPKLRNRAQSGVTEDTAVPALRRMRQKDFQSSKPASAT